MKRNRDDVIDAEFEGNCYFCGCTDERDCDGGCSWVNKDHTCCSQCDNAMKVLCRLPESSFRNMLGMVGVTRNVLAARRRPSRMRPQKVRDVRARLKTSKQNKQN